MSRAIELTGKTAWVTGAASGIGAASAEALASAGARIIAFDRAFPREAATITGSYAAPNFSSGTTTATIRREYLDLADRAALDAKAADLVAAGDAPDILVNNAGITADAVTWKLTDAQWDEVIDINLTAPFRLTRACCGAMRQRGSGAIINITSINGLRGKFGQANYAASKAGLIGVTKTWARELGRDGIRVNAVAPGFVESPLTATLSNEVRAAALEQSVLRRLATPADIADVVLFLASPLARHITGQVIVADGGQLI